MSVWRRLQRIGKKAAKFQFTTSLQELTVECSRQYRPGTFVIVWSRRSRRYTSKPFECVPSTESADVHTHVWAMPENMEFTTTLYRAEKCLQFEEKEWICQIEDVGSGATGRLSGPSVRRRVLATRQIDLSEFASSVPTQTSLKVVMRLASKKLISASLLLTLHSVIVKEGEATDEDMISIASLMSLSRAGSFSVGSGLTIHDVGGVGAFSPLTSRYGSSRYPGAGTNFHADLSELTAKLQELERLPHEDETEETTSQHGKQDNRNTGDSTKLQEKERCSFGSTASFAAVGDPLSNSTFNSTLSLPNTSVLNAKQESKALATQSGQDLLLWCQDVTKDYPNVKITDLTSSFQSGLAFCAILHHFFPDQLDFSELAGNTAIDNCRLAFNVAAKLGIPRVLDPAEVTSASRAPDLLSMMTYLHQLRTHCCGRSVTSVDNVEPTTTHRPTTELNGFTVDSARPAEPASPRSDSNHVIQNHKPSEINPNSLKSEVKTLSSTDSGVSDTKPTATTSGTGQKQTTSMRYEHMLSKARTMLQQTRLSQQIVGPFTDALPPLATTRKPLRPLSSASLATATPSSVTDGPNSIGTSIAHPSNLISQSALQRSSTGRKKSHRTLMRFNSDGTICVANGSPSTHSPSTVTSCLHQSMNISSSTARTPDSSATPNLTASAGPQPEGMKVRRLRLSQINLFASGRGSTAPVPIRQLGDSRQSGFSPTLVHKNKGIPNERVFPASASASPTTYRYALTDLKSPAPSAQQPTVGNPSCSNYISNEQAELEQAQRELDYEAAHLEQRLRLQMARGSGTGADDELLKRWFVLVSRKNTLIRRGMQLSIMEKEDDLKKKTQMLQEELRKLLSIEDYMKTESDRHREELLLQDLVQLVNERDDMIHELDLHEQALAEELTLEQNAAKALAAGRGRSDKCCIQ